MGEYARYRRNQLFVHPAGVVALLCYDVAETPGAQ